MATTSERDPRLEGFRQWEGCDPFEDMCGPMYFRQEEDGSYTCRLLSGEKHRNGQGSMHGGALMTFADFAVFVFARDHLDGAQAVTVSMHSEFTAAGTPGEMLEATGEIVHATRGMLFIRGIIRGETATLLNYSAVLKKLRPQGK